MAAIQQQQQQQQLQLLLLRAFDAVERSDAEGLRAVLLTGGGEENGEGAHFDMNANAVHPFDDTRPTLLHRACARGHAVAVRLLLREFGADATQADYWGFTALHKAADRGHARCVRELLLVAWHNSNSNNNSDIVNALDYNQSTPLVWAAWRGHLECVEILLKFGANVQQANGIGNTPLHVACREGRCAVVAALLEHYGKKKNAAAAGGDQMWRLLAARNDDGETPLDCCGGCCGARTSSNQHERAAQLILQAYAATPRASLHGILATAQYKYCCCNNGKEDDDGKNKADDDCSYSVKLDIGTLDGRAMHSLLELVLERDPGAIRRRRRGNDGNNHLRLLLPLAVACASGAPAAVVDFLLRADPDALLFL